MSTQPVRVGLVTSPFGVGGAVKVQPLTEVETRFAPGVELYLGTDRVRIEWARLGAGGAVVKFGGVDDRNAAESLRGRYLEVPAGDSPPAPEGAWYHHQLVGLAVSTVAGRELGRIEEILTAPANDVWIVRGASGEHLVPATRDAVKGVDVAGGTVTVADWLVEPGETA